MCRFLKDGNMKKIDISIINNLFQTDWHPTKGDYVKENTIKDGKIMEDQIRKHRRTVWSLWVLIIGLFAVSMVVLSL